MINVFLMSFLLSISKECVTMSDDQIIHQITLNELHSVEIINEIYNDPANYYWSSDWNSELYSELAYAGFISTAVNHPEAGAILLPEMQKEYAVLDWEDLHISRKVKRLVRNRRVVENGVHLRITDSVDQLIENCRALHGDTSWLLPEYEEILSKQISVGSPVEIIGVELRDNSGILAGELGYTIGATYTSLTGFSNRSHTSYNNLGSLQLVQLAKLLKSCGYHFWNLGHPYMEYKDAIGAVTTDRIPFLQRWVVSRDQSVHTPLRSLIGKELSLIL